MTSETLRARVRLYLDAGKTYNEAIFLAYRAGRAEETTPLVVAAGSSRIKSSS